MMQVISGSSLSRLLSMLYTSVSISQKRVSVTLHVLAAVWLPLLRWYDMASAVTRFALLCAGELVIVLSAMVSIPFAVALQILLPLVIFRDYLLYRPILFVAGFALGTIVFAAILVFFRHTLVPFVILAAFASLVLIVIVLAEARLQKQYGGAV
jgi:hypothetical protein